MLEKRHSAQFKGELCGDVLTLGLMVRAADQKCWGCTTTSERKIDVINETPTAHELPKAINRSSGEKSKYKCPVVVPAQARRPFGGDWMPALEPDARAAQPG